MLYDLHELKPTHEDRIDSNHAFSLPTHQLRILKPQNHTLRTCLMLLALVLLYQLSEYHHTSCQKRPPTSSSNQRQYKITFPILQCRSNSNLSRGWSPHPAQGLKMLKKVPNCCSYSDSMIPKKGPMDCINFTALKASRLNFSKICLGTYDNEDAFGNL